MATITKMEIQKRNKERVNLFLDGEYAFSISAELIYKEGLKVKSEIDFEKIKVLAENESLIRCKEAALRIIERAYKTEKEIRDKLKLKGYDDNSINYSVEFLKKYNYINDEAYAEAFINDKLNTMGSQKIKYTLVQKGVLREIIDKQLSCIDKDNEKKVAIDIARKKLAIIRKSESDKFKISGKLFRFMVSKGYGIDITNDVIKEIMLQENFDIEDKY